MYYFQLEIATSRGVHEDWYILHHLLGHPRHDIYTITHPFIYHPVIAAMG